MVEGGRKICRGPEDLLVDSILHHADPFPRDSGQVYHLACSELRNRGEEIKICEPGRLFANTGHLRLAQFPRETKRNEVMNRCHGTGRALQMRKQVPQSLREAMDQIVPACPAHSPPVKKPLVEAPHNPGGRTRHQPLVCYQRRNAEFFETLHSCSANHVMEDSEIPLHAHAPERRGRRNPKDRGHSIETGQADWNSALRTDPMGTGPTGWPDGRLPAQEAPPLPVRR